MPSIYDMMHNREYTNEPTYSDELIIPAKIAKPNEDVD